ncbi:MAG TPA: outer membrane protein assembly factor BamE [Gammaproteobacteria bacterium]|nr:outer membrane protein assembly factor BamE [Gammaproteobacteria bacterium]
MRFRLTAPAVLLLTALAAGCVYVPPVTQGNYLKQSDLKQLKVGMTTKQVEYLFGKPALPDPFEKNVWRYVYYDKPGARSPASVYRLTVYFKNGKVTRFTTSKPIDKAPT